MTDRPIIYSATMIKALLAGRKTQTRRVMKLPTKGQYVRPDIGGWEPTTVGGGSSFAIARDGSRVPVREMVAIWNRTTGKCIAAPHQVGDRLWVRESLRYDWTAKGWLFVADDVSVEAVCGATLETPTPDRWPRGVCPSIHLPRQLSRLTQIVTAVKIEKLQDISEADAVAEGCVEDCADGLPVWYVPGAKMERHRASGGECFEWLWGSINGTGSWDANPWVTATTFRVIKANIDTPEALVA
ncbi:hypothetical protein [Bradyrhizobium sp. SRS-191]|uniref:hypothetical protein n=1 Tax=Bradyrhizobium sp. SRS-191 TaxID=2962606 RepID=UPI00211E4F46|nr:hypothetical protein [Bradyrhizobium sp. SRS-191]